MRIAARACAGLFWSLAAASALVVAQTPAVAPADARDAGRAGDRITVVGCVVYEADYAARTAAPRVRDASGADAAEFAIVPVEGAGPPFIVTGRREAELSPHVGRRVEVAGTVELARVADMPAADAGAAASRPTSGDAGGGQLLPGTAPGAAGVTPEGSPAHEPGDARPGTGPPDRAGSVAATVIDLAELPRLNVVSIRRVDGACDRPPASTGETPPSAPSEQHEQSRSIAAGVAPPSDTASRTGATAPVTAIGCLMRATPTGPAISATEGELTLTRATLLGRDRDERAAGSAGDTGTLPASLPAAGGSDDRAFLLAADGAADLEELARHVGQRVSVVGVVEEGTIRSSDSGPASGVTGSETAANAESGAHPSAASDRFRVASFRVVPGNCF